MTSIENSNINLPLLITDIIFLPITVIRLTIIYFFSSRYNIHVLDVVTHASKKFFNQEGEFGIDIIDEDIRCTIHKSTSICAKNDVDIQCTSSQIQTDENAYVEINKHNENNENNEAIDTTKKNVNCDDANGITTFGAFKQKSITLSEHFMTELDSDGEQDNNDNKLNVCAEESPESDSTKSDDSDNSDYSSDDDNHDNDDNDTNHGVICINDSKIDTVVDELLYELEQSDSDDDNKTSDSSNSSNSN